MKWLIRNNEQVFAMSMNRSDAIKYIERYPDMLITRIVKCVVYGDSTGNLQHWVKEICNYLNAVNGVSVKPGAHKLKQYDYLKHLFRALGDSKNDARFHLLDFRSRFGEDYPDFEITDGLITKLFNTFFYMKENLPNLFASLPAQEYDFQPVVYKALDI